MPARRHTGTSSAPIRQDRIRMVGGVREPKELKLAMRPTVKSPSPVPGGGVFAGSGAARLSGADVFFTDEPKVIAKIGPHAAGPFGIGRALPGRCRLHIGRDQMIE